MSIYQQAVANIAAAMPGKEPGDYINPKDDLLYCGKCNTPKQYRIKIFGAMRTVPVICDCKKAERDAEDAAAEAIARQKKREELRIQCFANTDVANAQTCFRNDDQRDAPIAAAMQRYAKQWPEMRDKNIGLLLYGPVGTGKSFYAACIANALIDAEKPVPVLMTSLARIINTVQGMFDGRQEYIDSLARYPLLVLDDVGTERTTGYALEQVYNVIDARYRSGKPLIITTNTPIERIKAPETLEQQRIYSRLLEMCHPIKIDGPDRRREAVKQDYAARKKLLGL